MLRIFSLIKVLYKKTRKYKMWINLVLIIVFHLYALSMSYQSSRVPVLEEARTMVFVRDHNMITWR